MFSDIIFKNITRFAAAESEDQIMSIEKKLELFADVLEIDPDEITPETPLAELDWDSVAVLTFIAMMDEEFDKEVKGADIKKFVTVRDALDIMEE